MAQVFPRSLFLSVVYLSLLVFAFGCSKLRDDDDKAPPTALPPLATQFVNDSETAVDLRHFAGMDGPETTLGPVQPGQMIDVVLREGVNFVACPSCGGFVVEIVVENQAIQDNAHGLIDSQSLKASDFGGEPFVIQNNSDQEMELIIDSGPGLTEPIEYLTVRPGETVSSGNLAALGGDGDYVISKRGGGSVTITVANGAPNRPVLTDSDF